MECGCCKYLTIVLILIGAGLSIVAVTTSHWTEYEQDSNTTDPMVLEKKTIEINRGLWKACYIDEREKTRCVNIIHELDRVYPVPGWFKVVQAAEILSVISSVIAVVFWGCCFACAKDGSAKSVTCSKITTCIFCVLAALSHGVGVGLYIYKEKYLVDRFPSYRYGWSLWIAVAAGCVDIFATMVALISQPPTEYAATALY